MRPCIAFGRRGRGETLSDEHLCLAALEGAGDESGNGARLPKSGGHRMWPIAHNRHDEPFSLELEIHLPRGLLRDQVPVPEPSTTTYRMS